jgi:hypothetical protein
MMSSYSLTKWIGEIVGAGRLVGVHITSGRLPPYLG